MYRYLLRHKISILLYIVFAPISAVCSLAVSAGMAAAIDYANGGNLSDVWKYVIAFVVYIALDLAADQIFKNVRYRMVERTMVSLKSDVYYHISNMKPERFLSQNTAEFMSALTTDTEIVRDSYFSVLLDLYIQALRFVIAVVVLFYLSPVLGIFVLVTSILQTLVPVLYAKKLERAGAAYSSAQEQHLNTLKENLDAFLTAKTFHIEAKLEENYHSAVTNAECKKRSSKVLTVWASNLSFVFSRITHLGVFCWARSWFWQAFYIQRQSLAFLSSSSISATPSIC